VLWTAFIVVLIFGLMGLSIQLGWVLICLLLAAGFGSAGDQATERAPGADLSEIHVSRPDASPRALPAVAPVFSGRLS
jgi:hypothetical protein